jgi:hypothetical protein
MAQLASRLEVTYGHDHLKARQDILTILRRHTDNIRPGDMGVKNVTAEVEVVDVSLHEVRGLKRLVTEEIIQPDNIRSDDMGVKNITAGIEMLDVSSHEERRLKGLVTEEILQGLRYPTMLHRYEGVLDSYPETFEWAFQPCKLNRYHTQLSVSGSRPVKVFTKLVKRLDLESRL